MYFFAGQKLDWKPKTLPGLEPLSADSIETDSIFNSYRAISGYKAGHGESVPYIRVVFPSDVNVRHAVIVMTAVLDTAEGASAEFLRRGKGTRFRLGRFVTGFNESDPCLHVESASAGDWGMNSNSVAVAMNDLRGLSNLNSVKARVEELVHDELTKREEGLENIGGALRKLSDWRKRNGYKYYHDANAEFIFTASKALSSLGFSLDQDAKGSLWTIRHVGSSYHPDLTDTDPGSVIEKFMKCARLSEDPPIQRLGM